MCVFSMCRDYVNGGSMCDTATCYIFIDEKHGYSHCLNASLNVPQFYYSKAAFATTLGSAGKILNL